MNKKNKDRVKSSDGFIVLCCVCGKTRNAKGKWVAQEYSVAQNSGAVYSHGLCPDCMQSTYGNELWYKQFKKDSEGKSLPGAGGRADGIKRMLIIYDNSMITTRLTADFEDEFHVETAMSGTEGLILAMCWRPEVILLDINMSDMSGVDVVRRLKSERKTKNIPVIIVTANGYNDATKRKLRPYGNFKGFFSKMTSSEEIRETVWRVLR